MSHYATEVCKCPPFCGRQGLDRVFLHEMGPFCGRRGLDRVFLHEMGPFCGRRGPEWMLGRSFATATPPTGRPGASPRQRRRHDCVRCVGSGFDLALRDGVRIFERWSSNIGKAIAWFIGGATGQNHRQRSGSLFRQSLPADFSGKLFRQTLPADRLNIFIQQSQQSQPAKPFSKANKAIQLSRTTKPTSKAAQQSHLT